MFIDNMQKWCMTVSIDCKDCPMYDIVLERCVLKDCPQQWDVSRLIRAYTEILEIMYNAKEK